VLDASRSVGVVSNLLSDTARDGFVEGVSDEYQEIRDKRAGNARADKHRPIADARAAKPVIDWSAQASPKPKLIGIETFDNYPLVEIASRIDWTPFFRTWELKGTYPSILKDKTVGETAQSVLDDGLEMLKEIIIDNWLSAKAVVGIFPANSVGDDVEVYTDDSRSEVLTTFHFLRQQMEKSEGRSNYCLADFIAPKDSGVADHIGGFAVTTGLGIEKKIEEFEKNHDDYRSILLKALADRLAEAFAERMHERVRREFWGYEVGDDKSNDDLIKESYQGVRPAPGYPACPDHTEKAALFELLSAGENASVELTESFAMMPASSVSGFYFSYPDSRYFGIGRIGRDQAEDYAERKGMTLEVAEKWLAPNLGY
jgi:5-methyltetrahydrofolate--homocysteine methyltransferase